MSERNIADECITYLGRSYREQVEVGNRDIFGLIYHCWQLQKAEFGFEKGKERYKRIWSKLIERSFAKAKEALGYEKVDDVRKLGKIREYMSFSYPCMYEISEHTDDVHIGHITFCPNPYYGPADNFMDRLEYYGVEAEITDGLYKETAELAGISDQVDAKLGGALCLGGPFCEAIFKRRE